MPKLTNAERNEIISKVMSNTFDKRESILNDKNIELGEKIFSFIDSKYHITENEALLKNFCSYHNDITVEFSRKNFVV